MTTEFKLSKLKKEMKQDKGKWGIFTWAHPERGGKLQM